MAQGTSLCGENNCWNSQPSKTTRNLQQHMQEGVEELNIEAEQRDDKKSLVLPTITETNLSTVTTNYSPRIACFIKKILLLKKDIYVDLAVWKWNREDSITLFRVFIDSITSEQGLIDMDYYTNVNLTVFEKAQGMFNQFLKGVRYAKHLKSNGLAHRDNLTKSDAHVGEHRDADTNTLEGLSLKLGPAPPGGTKTGTLEETEALKKLEKH